MEARPRFPVLRAARIAAGLAWGLSAIHRERVVYGDLGPGRVVLLDGDVPRLQGLDAPRGRDGMRLRSGLRVPGDPGYLAPEVLRGEPPTPRSDVFSLGCLLHAMLAGEPPAGRGSPEEVARTAMLREAPDVGSLRFWVPRALRRALREMLRLDPSERPDLAGELPSRLEAAAERIARLPWYRYA